MMSATEKSEAGPGMEKPGEGSIIDEFTKEGLEVRGLELRLGVVFFRRKPWGEEYSRG